MKIKCHENFPYSLIYSIAMLSKEICNDPEQEINDCTAYVLPFALFWTSQEINVLQALYTLLWY